MRRAAWIVALLCMTHFVGAVGVWAQESGETKEGVVFCLYTVQDATLKLTAQLYPLEEGDARAVVLEVNEDGAWREVARSGVVLPGWTAHFRVEDWDHTQEAPYRVRLGEHGYEGLIRRDPVDKETIVAAAFTGNSPGSGGGKISKRDVVEHVRAIDPDVLLFAGDQVYNHNNHTEHWIAFGEDFGDLTRDRPTVTIPDDHDVGHPNLWGANGRATKRDWDGGYLKPPEYVNMVQRQQTSHLPDPYDPTPIEQGISVYYTALNVGGIDFAIVEDRKFKSACSDVAQPGLGPRPDHVTVADYDPKTFDLPGRKLLGDRQLAFLDAWAQDWDGVVMKAMVSQTVLSMASTYHSKTKQFYYADFDANGWPQAGRNKAVDALRRAFAIHISGDQHLSTIIQYGIDDWRDAGWSFCVPSIANFYPRWWLPKQAGQNPEPGAQDNTGDFLDGFGNRMTVYAHTNPVEMGREPKELLDGMPGFGVVRFNKKTRTITMECWPRMTDPADSAGKQYEGWPRTIHQYDNYGREAVAWLPTVEVQGTTDPVVKVFKQDTGALVYALRIQGRTFAPRVFSTKAHMIVVSDGMTPQRFEGLLPHAQPGGATLAVQF